MAHRHTFEEVRKWAQDYWGLTFMRNDPRNRGWWSGCWKSGYSVEGPIPGYCHSWRRFNTIAEAARVLQVPTKQSPPTTENEP